MIVTPVKTKKVIAGDGDIFGLLDEFLPKLKEKSIIAITSKVVAICEGRVLPEGEVLIDELAKQESDYYLPTSVTKYDFRFTIIHGSLIPRAGIDESNGNGKVILWPEDPARSANQIRNHLRQRDGLKNLGIILTDSTVRPLHYGTEGIAIAFSGFKPSKSYVGKPDLFGRKMKVSVANVADALAAAAVLEMGEGTEQTPLAIIENYRDIEFQDKNPSLDDLNSFFVPIGKDDLFAPLLGAVKWQRGGKNYKK